MECSPLFTCAYIRVGICFLRFVFQKIHLVPQVSVGGRVSCAALELVFCGAHEWEYALLWVVWKMSYHSYPRSAFWASPTLQREEMKLALIPAQLQYSPRVRKVTMSPRNAQERRRHAGCFYTVTGPELVGFNWKICFSAVRGRYYVPEEC